MARKRQHNDVRTDYLENQLAHCLALGHDEAFRQLKKVARDVGAAAGNGKEFEMDYTVVIHSIGIGDEIEWTQKVTSQVSMRGARQAATNWIDKNIFTEDVEITKRQNAFRDYWYIR